MRIQNNIMAMNAFRNYTANSGALGKNLEKLSSGYRINRAGDDAAGLAISEKMRAQITGLDAAQKNVQDGISLVKTAEGALQEVEDMLNRMVYLAEQAANGTYDDDVDRVALQDEVDSLCTEIQRIGETANFNGKNLLDGQMADITLQIGDAAENSNQLEMKTALGAYSVMNFKDGFIQKGAAADTTAAAMGSPATVCVADADEARATLALLRGGTPTSTAPAISAQNGLINQVSSYRAKLGAVQNRLEHTAKNLSVMEENIQNAESAIRDVDLADEMTSYTKNNILLQSAQAMLAQSNQMPQGVLQLLQ